MLLSDGHSVHHATGSSAAAAKMNVFVSKEVSFIMLINFFWDVAFTSHVEQNNF